MAVSDVRVFLRAASSENIRPRALQQSAVALAARVVDQSGDPIAGAIVHLGYQLTNGMRFTIRDRVTNSAGWASASLALDDIGIVRGFVEVVSPQVETYEREIEMVARKTLPPPRNLRPLATRDGRILTLRNGRAMSGGRRNV